MNEQEKLLAEINKKYEALGQNTTHYLEGLKHAKPIDYWDYIEVDTLLSLQRPRTDFPDEMVFIMYHQVTEIILKMMTHEVHQICDAETLTASFFAEKVGRMNRYTTMLTSSFDIMRLGMDPKQYNQFRMTLTPASGFQCASFRLLEIYTSDLENLVDARMRGNLPEGYTTEFLFENAYWQAAGKDRKTGKKSHTLSSFENKYLDTFIKTAESYKKKNIWQKYLTLPAAEKNDESLKKALRDFDVLINIEWPLVHLRSASQYLDNKKGEVTEATGGSDWKKYLHPMYQKRIFFPDLWSAEEKENWAKDYKI